MNSPLVSVIIPVFNAERYLSEALYSVLSQGYPNLEFIIVDDGSTDRSKEIIDRTPGKIRYLQQPNRGPAAARNRGIDIAEGDIFAFQDSDDIWPPRKLEIQLATLDKDPALEIVMGQVQRIQSSESTSLRTDVPSIENMDAPAFGVNLAASIFRRSAFERVGPFDEQLRFSEDVDWFMRARELGVKTAMINDVTLLYRMHEQNMTRDKGLTNLNTFRVLKMSLDRRRRESGRADSLPALIDLGEQRSEVDPERSSQ